MISLKYKIEESLGRFIEDDYVRPVVIKVIGEDEQCGQYEVGRLYADLVAWAEALDLGESLEDICDNDSEGLLWVFQAIAHESGEIREDLVDVPSTNVLFIYDITLAPSLHEYKQAILYRVANLFGDQTLTVSWLTDSGFQEAELAELGFKKIAATPMIFRHNCLLDHFSERNPQGAETWDFEPKLEDEKWVKRELLRKGHIRRRGRDEPS